MALKPASMKASSKANEVAWSTFQPNTLPPSISGAMRRSDWPRRRRSIGWLYSLAQRCVELVQHRLAGAKLILAERIERPVDRMQVGVQVFRVLLDIEQAGDDLALGGVMLQEAQSGRAVIDLVVGGELAQGEPGAIVLLHHLDGARLGFHPPPHGGPHESETG